MYKHARNLEFEEAAKMRDAIEKMKQQEDFGYKFGKKKRGAEEAAPNLRMLSPEQIVREIKRLEAEMYKRARNLEFEEAARLRDAIEKLKQRELGLDDPNTGTG